MQLGLGCLIVLHRSRRLFYFSARLFAPLVVWHQITCNLFPSCWWPWPADCQPLLLHMKRLPGAGSDKLRRSDCMLQVPQASKQTRKLQTPIWVKCAGFIDIINWFVLFPCVYSTVFINPILWASELQSLFPEIPVFFVRAETYLVGEKAWLGYGFCRTGLMTPDTVNRSFIRKAAQAKLIASKQGIYLNLKHRTTQET